MAATTQVEAVVRAPGRERSSAGFRPDIEGMRAVAVLLVVLFHAGVTALPGGFVGVDVFFVLSGFLITRLLVGEARRTGGIRLADFWARRARRLLPASTLTLAVVAVASALLVDPVTQVQTGRDIVAGAAFASNWWFAAQATDYFAGDIDRSPVLHFWSLSVEEQYYVVWPPLLALLLLLLVRRRGLTVGSSLRPAWWLLAGLGLASFAWSVHLTVAHPDAGYFSTLSRAWELAIGGMLAIAVTTGLRMRSRPGAVLGLAGLAAVLLSAALITDSTPFPGVAALAPVLGTAAVILAGTAGSGQVGVAALLSWRPLQVIGRLSYSWYLWHWPFLILAPALMGPLDGPRTVLVVLASLAAAQATFRLVEDPVRRSRWLARRPGRSLALGALLIAIGLGSGLLLGRHATAGDQGIHPVPAVAAKDLSPAHLDGCLTGFGGVSNRDCRYGEVGSGVKYVLIGDSHAVQWFPAAQEAARRAGAELIVLGKSSCMPLDMDIWSYRLERRYDECAQWRDDAMRRIEALPRGSVVLVAGWHDHYLAVDEQGRRLSGTVSRPLVSAAYARSVRQLQDAGMTVVPIRDTPEPPGDPARCVSEHPDDIASCGFPRPDSARGIAWEEQALRSAGISAPIVDLTDLICRDDTCPSVVDGVLRWRDGNHLSNTYVTELAPAFADQVAAAVVDR